jgi:predicted MFS family arabinose efflux permease
VKTIGAGDKEIMQASTVIVAIIFGFFYPLATTKLHVFLVVTPIALATSALYTTMTTLLTLRAPPSKAGSVIGLSHGVRTICQMIGPLFSAYYSNMFGYEWTFRTCGIIVAFGFLTNYLAVQKK